MFKFLVEMEGLTFPEALRLLADEAGIKVGGAPKQSSLPASGAEETSQPFLPKEELFRLNQLALDFYYRQTRNFPKAIDYFVSRGLSKETTATSVWGTHRQDGRRFWILLKARASPASR